MVRWLGVIQAATTIGANSKFGALLLRITEVCGIFDVSSTAIVPYFLTLI
jgi:hypothetical protein